MRYLIDTGLLIRHLRGQKSTVLLLRGLSRTNRLCISSVSRLELRAGEHRDEHAATGRLLSRFMNLNLDTRVADEAGKLVRHGKQANRPILVPDAIIAATALIHGITLVTLNAQDFVNVANLSLHPLSISSGPSS